ncbi:MAG: PDGLE domain-containing protein [Candidatus Odinarchaeota archaeon]
MGLNIIFPRWAKITLIGIIILLAVFIPLASVFPDGLERVAETLGVSEGEPLWTAPIPDYFINLGGEWLGTLIPGLIGITLVTVVTVGVSLIYLKYKKR